MTITRYSLALAHQLQRPPLRALAGVAAVEDGLDHVVQHSAGGIQRRVLEHEPEPGRPQPSQWLYKNTSNNSGRFVLGTHGDNPLVCVAINPSTAEPRLEPFKTYLATSRDTPVTVAQFAASIGQRTPLKTSTQFIRDKAYEICSNGHQFLAIRPTVCRPEKDASAQFAAAGPSSKA